MYQKNIKLLKVFNFLIGFTFFAPLAIVYFSQVSGSYTLGASIFGITMLSAAVFELPTGVWSDKVGRRNTIILGSWARVIAYLCYALGFSYWWLVVGAVFEGLSRSFYSGNNNAFLYDTLADSNHLNDYSEYLGKTSSMEHIALAVSASIGGIVASFSFTWLLWLAVASQLLLLAVSYQFTNPKSYSTKATNNIYKHIKEAIHLFIHNRKLRMLSLASIIDFSFGEIAYQFQGAFFLTVWPVWAIGLANILSDLGASISYYFSGYLIKKLTALKVLILDCSFGYTISIIGLLIANWISPIIMSLGSLLYGSGMVAESQLMQSEFTEQQRATMGSLNSLAGNIGFATMALILGGLADQLGPRLAMLILMLCVLPTTLIYIRLQKEAR
jgi:MFS family permease